jgi:transcriptional regulator with PAS, ATPase and Fis domain
MLGVVLTFEEITSVRNLANNIAGTKAHFTFKNLVGKSEPFRKSLGLAQRASQGEVTVLLQGETGTGKELFAQAIHNGGARQSYPFVPINCGAIPGELLESELFGYVEGAFTGAQKGGRPGKFELANNGTILLDEIGDMPHDMQVKLLRVLQTGEVYRIGAREPIVVSTRIIASTHVDLARAVSRKRFREDLYYRLNVFPITIPPLRDRGDIDIKALVHIFLNRSGAFAMHITPAALQVLTSYHWPGNVRELENTIERALHLCECELLDVQHLKVGDGTNNNGPIRLGTLEEMECKMIAATLKKTNSNMAATAKILGISRATLYRKVKQYKL